ncbi:carbohydrate-binding module family 13 protein [Ephemerocybe angulata]|uniref:Carbohydrate-binding module family 13 protein n=1 Tax=Ephemerocybe angulata TaxID=980116 RepID=A0A8H6LZ88_9AGAR|nr:carbohydrate-binding module family 13 protein [Tulosesus angulatus]
MSEITSGNRYKITNAQGGTVLDLSIKNGRTINGWNWHGTDNQIWQLEQVEGGPWRFRNVSNGKYLAAEGNPRDGLQLIGSEQPFNWHMWRDERDQNTYRIVYPDTVFNVDLSGNGDPTGGTPIELWGRHEAVNQTWRFEQV